MSDLVSVVFPVGPGVRDAGLALQDVLEQTYRNLDVIAVLNGCDGAVREELIHCRDERVTVIDLGEKPCLLDALDVAVEKAQGPWLARMDADDRCDKTRIEKQVALLEKGAHEVVSCGISLRKALGEGMQRYVDWVNGLKTPEAVFRERFVESPVVQPTVILSKKVFLEAGGYLDNGFAEDYDLWLRLLEKGARFGKVGEDLYFWQDRGDRLTRTDPRFEQKKMLELKAAALARMPGVRDRGVAISGAGPIGRVLGRELLARGVNVRGFFEVSPKKVGGSCQGRPIAGLDEFGTRWREAILLSAVGVAGGRSKVRTLASGEGYREGEDFWCCC
ncbi:MAG: glycosyltransferase family 2 protein [Akkermansiaceae bacterium]